MRGRLALIAFLVVATAAAVPARAGTAGQGASPITGHNLLLNPGGESGSAAMGVSDPAAPPPGWTVTGSFSQMSYGGADFPDATDSRTVGGGNRFLAGGPGGPSVATATQVVDLSGDGAVIDGGGVYASLRAALGGFGLQSDYGTVDAIFRASNGDEIARMRVGPVTVDDRGGLPVGGFQGYGHTELVKRAGLAHVPAGTRSIAVVLSSVRLDGTYGDGYFDNVSLSLRGTPSVQPPRMARTLIASRVRGQVLVKEPGGRGTHRLSGSQLLPMHSLIDASGGLVKVTTAANRLGELQSGDFRGGAFTVGQRSARRPFTLLTLHGGNLGACAAGTTASAARAHRRKLFGRSHGHFRSRGHSSSATTRGTTWSTDDSCAGTATSVEQGKIDIHDFTRNAVVPIARGVRPDLSAHDPEPCPPGVPCNVQAGPPGRKAGSSYVAGGRRR